MTPTSENSALGQTFQKKEPQKKQQRNLPEETLPHDLDQDWQKPCAYPYCHVLYP